ncbi:MAG: cytochrome C biogenesis protein [Firmicutes bacterium HGW-Firmicutes-14]|nr:MAG: cytochrome C biogenesis protein [Firmicutes bacterium HGW-Firmicutes-14]
MFDVRIQLILFWVSVGFCFLGTVFFIVSLSFKREGLVKYGVLSSLLAFPPMTAALIFRWVQTGHVPSIGMYEVFTIYACGVLLFFLIAQALKPSVRIAGTVVLPTIMLMTGIGIMSSTELTELPKTYFTYWLGIHMLFATLALGGILISAGLAVIYLVKGGQEARGMLNPLLAKLPPLNRLDYLGYRFSLFAFIMIGIMIASGAVWAYKSWGRYWGWDPIETWSLISWLAYGAYLHLRVMGIKGKTAAWLHMAVIALVIFSFFGAPYLYPTIHDRFVDGTGL